MLYGQWAMVWAIGFLLATIPKLADAPQADSFEHRSAPIAFSQSLVIGGCTIQIDLAEGSLALPRTELVGRIRAAAQAVTIYYGRFPVPRARILVLPVAGKHGVLQGTTWGNIDGFPAFLRLRIGQLTTTEELSATGSSPMN